MVEAGTWQIAPVAARSSARARLLILLWLPLLGLALGRIAAHAGLSMNQQGPAVVWTALLLGFVVIGSLCEPQPSIVGVYTPYLGRGGLRRAAGLVLAPGWASGVVYVALVVGGVALTAWVLYPENVDRREIVSVLAAVLLPVTFMRRIPRARPPVVYVASQLVSFGLGAVSPLAELMGVHGLAVAAAWLLPLSPVMRLVMRAEQPDLVPDVLDWTGWAVSAVIVLAALVVAARELRATERRVLASRAVPAAPAAAA
jgi:hypothetical protein